LKFIVIGAIQEFLITNPSGKYVTLWYHAA
jgi:hypothetical protein